MIPKGLYPQRDFSGGQMSSLARRRDDTKMQRAGLRKAENFRSRAEGGCTLRSGRRPLFVQAGRTEWLRMTAEKRFKIAFSDERVTVYEADGSVAFTSTAVPWTAGALDDVRWARFDLEVFMCWRGSRPKVLTYDDKADTWAIADFAFRTNASGKVRAPVWRYAPRGIAITPSDFSGSVTVTASAAAFTAGMVGCIIRYYDRQLLITAFTSSTSVTATVIEDIPPGYQLTLSDDSKDGFQIGDVVENITRGGKGYVRAKGVTSGTTWIKILVIPPVSKFRGRSGSGDTLILGDKVVGPNAKEDEVNPVTKLTAPLDSDVWTEQAVSDYRGWPWSVAADRGRLIFSRIPGVPNGILWSAIGDPRDFDVTGNADGAIFETLQANAAVLEVAGGADQFVFCDTGLYYIPISAADPLQPGSIDFRVLSSDGAAFTRPVATPEGLAFINAERTRVLALVGTGQTARPYVVRDITEYHSPLVKSPRCIEMATGDGENIERYLYVVNEDGSLMVGRFNAGEEWVGWFPWVPLGDRVTWISCFQSQTIASVERDVEFGTITTVDLFDDTAALDALIDLGAYPGGLEAYRASSLPTYGKLFLFAGGMVDVFHDGEYLGERAVDDLGNLIEADGETLTEVLTVVGSRIVGRLVPFVPNTGEGDSKRQRTRLRRVSKLTFHLEGATTFSVEGEVRLDPVRDAGLLDPSGGIILDPDDVDLLAPSADLVADPVPGTFTFRPLGRSHDPQPELLKDVPGPLTVLEIDLEVNI
ncbi:hypothetical protein [Xanthobacter flavus]|uniref:hypothetical protein n=1 Tax=Xanthobacter flavus TaxID=281 RepID=UPI00372B0241